MQKLVDLGHAVPNTAGTNQNTSQYTSVAEDSKRESVEKQEAELGADAPEKEEAPQEEVDAAPEPTPILAGGNSIEDLVADMAAPSIEDAVDQTEDLGVALRQSSATAEVADESPMVHRELIVNGGEDRSRSHVRQIQSSTIEEDIFYDAGNNKSINGVLLTDDQTAKFEHSIDVPPDIGDSGQHESVFMEDSAGH